MTQRARRRSAAEREAEKVREAVKAQVHTRFYRALNYLTIYAFILIVYGGALLVEYILSLLVGRILIDYIQKYTIVSKVNDYAQIGLALFLILGAVVHGVLSTYSQIKLDMDLAKEGNSKL